MLTPAQTDVLIALNDLIESTGTQVDSDGPNISNALRDRLNDDPSTNGVYLDQEIATALSDLHELQLINGVVAFGATFPVTIFGLTARGRQELP